MLLHINLGTTVCQNLHFMFSEILFLNVRALVTFPLLARMVIKEPC